MPAAIHAKGFAPVDPARRTVDVEAFCSWSAWTMKSRLSASTKSGSASNGSVGTANIIGVEVEGGDGRDGDVVVGEVAREHQVVPREPGAVEVALLLPADDLAHGVVGARIGRIARCAARIVACVHTLVP